MAKSDLFLAFNEITETHHLPREIVIEALKQALVSAYRRDSGISAAQKIEAEVDPNTSKYNVLVEKEVVDEVMNERTEIEFGEARKIDPNIEMGDTIMAPEDTNTRSFGRIAAQTAKQVILQKIREAERKALYDEYKDREGDLVSGQVQSVNNQHITISLGRAEAIMPSNQQIKGERYHTHDRIRTYVMEVKESNRGPSIIVSRAHRNMLRRLLEYEVPEIYNGQVEIKNIAREAGHRSKVAVAALQAGVDPVGACVGIRGARIQSIVKELKDEKIDVIEWNNDPSIFIAKALSPARVTGVYLEEDLDQGNTATVIVPDDQLSLAIGREGQNARLAAKLTGWRIDIKSVTEAATDAYSKLSEPALAKLSSDQGEMVAEVERILEKKKADRAVMPEEYQILTRFVQLAEQKLLEYRESQRSQRRKIMERARATVPAFAFNMPLSELELARDIEEAIKFLPNVGELMVRVLADEEHLQATLKAGNAGTDAMDAIREAIDSLVLAKQDELAAADAEARANAPTVVDLPVSADAALVETQPAVEVSEGEEEFVPPAFIDEDRPAPRRDAPLSDEPTKVLRRDNIRQQPQAQAQPAAQGQPRYEPTLTAEDEAEEWGQPRNKGKKKTNKRGRELVFDERRGEVVAKRKHKRKGNDWGVEDE
ncbi:MAG: transcription termination factor NusA [Anaerolineae bacterium]|nr:transcription termination/antitermination protein NusA [Anaerolineae bacterium]